MFPFINPPDLSKKSVVREKPKEYEWSVESGNFVIQFDGRIRIVEGVEAIRIWIYKALMTKRFRYQAYSWDFGSELESLIGKGLTREAVSSEAKRLVSECLFINSEIKDIQDFAVDFGRIDAVTKLVVNDSSVRISFTAVTDWGNIPITL